MKVSDIAKKMIGVICGLCALLAVGSIVYYRSLACLSFILGVLLGMLLNIVKVIMLDRVVSKITDMEADKAGNYATIQQFLRFLLTGVVLVVSAVLQSINIWGTVAGIFTFHIATFSMKYFITNKKE